MGEIWSAITKGVVVYPAGTPLTAGTTSSGSSRFDVTIWWGFLSATLPKSDGDVDPKIEKLVTVNSNIWARYSMRCKIYFSFSIQ
jgi:hypothetical protein